MTVKHKLSSLIQRFRLPIIILLIGVLLLLWPAKESAAADPGNIAEDQTMQILSQTQQELKSLLAQVDGAGRVELMLSLKYGEHIIYQTDEKSTSDSYGTTKESTTVLLSQGSSEKLPLVSQKRCPVYQGAVVVCEGADRASVRLAIMQAVSSLTGLGSDKITVIKMKGH